MQSACMPCNRTAFGGHRQSRQLRAGVSTKTPGGHASWHQQQLFTDLEPDHCRLQSGLSSCAAQGSHLELACAYPQGMETTACSTDRPEGYPTQQNILTVCWRALRQRQMEMAQQLQRFRDQHPRRAQLLAMGAAAPILPASSLEDVLSNRVLMTGFIAWFIAQFAKIFTKRYKKGVWDIKALVEPGGMPSSHSALCSGVTTALALQYGLGSPLFAVSLAFSVIVMYDAMGVRQHAGKQAEVLNKVILQVIKIDKEGSPGPLVEDPNNPGEFKKCEKATILEKIPLKEVLGHTPRQVVAGGTLGVIVGVLYAMKAAGQL